MSIFKRRFVRIYSGSFIPYDRVYHIYIGEKNDYESFKAASEQAFRKVYGTYGLEIALKKDCKRSSLWEWIHNLLFPNNMIISIEDYRVDPEVVQKVRQCFDGQDFPKVNVMANVRDYKYHHPDAVFLNNELYYSRDEDTFYLANENGQLLPLILMEEDIQSIYTKFITDKYRNYHKCDLCAHWNCLMGNEYCKGCMSYNHNSIVYTYSKFEPRGLIYIIHE